MARTKGPRKVHRHGTDLKLEAATSGRRGSLRKVLAYVSLGLGALVIAAALLLLIFGGAILNGYAKGKMERAFAKACPGYTLQIGRLDYTARANRLVVHSATLSSTKWTLKVGQISWTGVRWVRLLLGTTALEDVLARASLDATTLKMTFPSSNHGIQCARLRASVPDSELIAEGIELQPLLGDETLFAASPFRTTRFRVVVPKCSVSGLLYRELLQGKSYRARSIQISHATFDGLVNRDKPVGPFVKSPLMVHEALAVIRKPLLLDSVTITDGHIRYGERVTAGASPGVLTFTAVNISAEGIANRPEASANILIRAQGNLMDAGTLKVMMEIPVSAADLSLQYSGSLGAMDLTRLDAFLDRAEHTRIKSGAVKQATFAVDVTAGQARGRVRGLYSNLKIAFLDKQTDTEDGLQDRVASFLANAFKIRDSNPADTSGSMKEGKVSYARRPNDTFLQFAWFALRSGVLDAISR
jgi:hypothetical protein